VPAVLGAAAVAVVGARDEVHGLHHIPTLLLTHGQSGCEPALEPSFP
jgi:hypothetical protein